MDISEEDRIIRGAEEYAVFDQAAYRIPRVCTDEDDNDLSIRLAKYRTLYRTFIVSRY